MTAVMPSAGTAGAGCGDWIRDVVVVPFRYRGNIPAKIQCHRHGLG